MKTILYSNQINFLKLVAIILMVVDHIGMILYPDIELLRVVGRSAFVLFSFLIAYNYIFNTSNKIKYIQRLLLFAFISQLPYLFAMFVAGRDPDLNIFFTFSLSLIFIYLIEQKINSFILFLYFIILIYITGLVEYGFLGVLLTISFFYYLKEKASIGFILILLFFLEDPVLSFYILSTSYSKLLEYNIYDYMYICSSLFSLIIIFTVKNIKDMYNLSFLRNKLFYWFYPVHLFILALINILFFNFYFFIF